MTRYKQRMQKLETAFGVKSAGADTWAVEFDMICHQDPQAFRLLKQAIVLLDEALMETGAQNGRGGNKATGAEKGRTVASSVELTSKDGVNFYGGKDADGVRLFDDSDGACAGRVDSLFGAASGACAEDDSQGDCLGDGRAGALSAWGSGAVPEAGEVPGHH